MRTVIFDLDGTLADTSADLVAAANACFRGLGHGDLLDPQTDALTAFHGGRAMLRLGFSRLGRPEDPEIDTQYPALLEHYARDILVHTYAYPGAIDAVEALRMQGFAVGICTNKPAGLAESLLAKMGVRDLFASMIGADTLPVRKPDPAPYVAAVTQAGGQVARSLLVGDTETDRKTAAAAGVPSVLVTFGPEGPGIARLAPEALLDRYEDLPALAERLLGAH
ncbi:HAD-IA family hydrolase [Frigidibacter albus]|uniref:phosphoglycolate phosphatase n=1 Tax=Frigidibacter albus TaxID=1465486 RepID=A0A6L8VES9_9RHOB|nr:HAD-IA family hydrolase [Frigidibacter albus]MZQ88241.1 HAD-IA family hydrolase [Frigidibacter albus]NBE30085.1 HAD-IA family hydrolase [Frigidibacter albus]GGH46595.1 phosphoglycolate phosphatase [Frigidibacter albus]